MLRDEIVDGAWGWSLGRPWSMAAAERHLRANRNLKPLKENIDRSRKAMAKYVEELTGKLAAPGAAAPPKAAVPPAGGGKAPAAGPNGEGGGAVVAAAPAAEAKHPALSSSQRKTPRYLVSLRPSCSLGPTFTRPCRESSHSGMTGVGVFFAARTIRTLAETAAEHDERLRRWVSPLIEAGDKDRRKVQDALFGHRSGTRLSPENRSGIGRSVDRQAIELAKTLSETMNLLNRLCG